jgi:hypothetical protein
MAPFSVIIVSPSSKVQITAGNGFTTRFFNDSTFYLDLLGKGRDARKEKHN